MDRSPLEAALEQRLPGEEDALAMLLMCYHDFDRRMCKKIWREHGFEFYTMGVDRQNKGYFLHAQYLVGAP